MVIVLLDECRKRMRNTRAIEVVGCNDISCNVICMILNISRHQAILYYSIPYRCLFSIKWMYGCTQRHTFYLHSMLHHEHHYLPFAPLFARPLPIFVSCLHIVGSRCAARAGDLIWCSFFRCLAENLEARHGGITGMILLPIPLLPSRRSLKRGDNHLCF